MKLLDRTKKSDILYVERIGEEMINRYCTIIENDAHCPERHLALGLCEKHYQRNRRHGDPLEVKRILSDNPRSYQAGDDFQECVICGNELPLTAFTVASARRSGRATRCRDCDRWFNIEKKYGLSKQQYENMLQTQGGKCANPGCGATESGSVSGYWNIDHNHGCCGPLSGCPNCVRGLLCSNCNLTLGMISDNQHKLSGLVEYLQRYQNNT